jgi:hypothetical protein
MRPKRLAALSAAAVLLASGLAHADARDEGDGGGEGGPVRLRRDRPQLAVGVDVGLDRYTAAHAGDDLGFGPAWQVRIGAQLHPVVSIDARYFGTRHELSGALLAQGFSFEPRISLPLRVRPYLSTGVGWYTVTAYRGDVAIVQAPVAIQLPISLGAEYLLNARVGLQAEGTYRILLDQGAVDGAYFARTQVWGGTLGARAYF